MPDGAFFCEKCGELMVDQGGGAASPPENGGGAAHPPEKGSGAGLSAQPAATVQQTTVRFCPSCGTRIEPGTKFCPSCGAKQPQDPARPAVPGAAAPSTAGTVSVTFTKTAANENFSPIPPRRPGMGASMRVLGEFRVTIHDGSGMRLLTGGLNNNGKLAVYSDRLEFKPGVLNMMDNAFVIQVGEIVSAGVTSVTFGIPNGVQIVLRSGKEYVFIPNIWEKTRLIELIQAQMRRP